jgi:hypothetical protein
MNLASYFLQRTQQSGLSPMLLALVVGVAITFIAGCGSTPALNATVPAILTEPLNQGVRLGEGATFAVNVQGTPPLTYQWSKNNTAIAGATAASYSTPPVSAGDSGSSFTVTISNAAGSITSTPALLTVGPRAPQTGDWRFQGMDLIAGCGPPSAPGCSTLHAITNLFGLGAQLGLNYLGTPLTVGAAPGMCGGVIPYNCSWGYALFNLPYSSSGALVGGITSWYESDSFENLEHDIDAACGAGNNVITAIDLEPANDIFAASSLQTITGGTFNASCQWIAPQNVQTLVSQLGQQSQVVTAVTFYAGQVLVVSEAWQSDTATLFEAKAVFATADSFTSEAMNLAGEGYIITALGADPTDGVLLIGTRVQGDTIARPVMIGTPAGTQAQGQQDANIEVLQRNVWTNSGDVNIAEQ